MKRDLGSKIKFIRTKLFDYTQDYMAQRLYISQNAYCKIENGRVLLTYDRLLQIAEIFKMSVEDMLNIDEKFLINNCFNSESTLSGYIYNHNVVQELKVVYERLLQTQKEKYEMQIELLQIKLKAK